MPKYTIGVDFGSLSGRAVLVDVADGREVASAQMNYPHAVMDRELPGGKVKLPPDWALQHPQDFMDVLDETLPKMAAAVNPEDIIGIGLDCTCSSAFPVSADGTPLYLQDKWKDCPHAYVMMWKHHACQSQAMRMTETAEAMQEPWLPMFGDNVNAEWYFPKLLQILEEQPELYREMDQYVEMADWLVWQLTGRLTRGYGCLGYKTFYNGEFPRKEFFAALNPAFENVVEEKLGGPIVQLGECAGCLTEEMAKRFGLKAGTPVAAANIDAHVCVPAVGIDAPGQMLVVMGTSSCHLVLGDAVKPVPGICAHLFGGMVPGHPSYEAGQSCVGDHFHWFENNCVPEEIRQAAREQGKHVQTYLTELAEKLKPGESGLLALDWWNGNRSVLMDMDLTGMMLGMTLLTRPEEIYRALIEATAYGTRMIVENYREHGVPVDVIYASGGVAYKNALAIQIYTDVLNMPIRLADAAQGPAQGSALFAAVAAGAYPDTESAIHAMAVPSRKTYTPNAEAAAVYEKLYQEYKLLHDYFGRGENNVMKRLKEIRTQTIR